MPYVVETHMSRWALRMNVALERTLWSTILFRGLLFVVLWCLLTDGSITSWGVGIPAVALSTTVSITLLPRVAINWYEFFKFLPLFFVRSLRGGVDVAWRAFHVDIPMTPDLIEYRMRLSSNVARVVMVNVVSLLPGTLIANLDDDVLKVHVLDSRTDFRAELETIELRIARIYNISFVA